MRHLYIKHLEKCILIYLFLLISMSTLLWAKPDRTDEDWDKLIGEQYSDNQDSCHTNPPSFELRAMMMPCSVNNRPCPMPDPASTSKQPNFACQDEGSHDRLVNCTKKLIITVKMSNVGKTHCKNQYVVLDHVYDPSSEQKQRLLYPYVLKISQKPIMQTYSLQKEGSVNEKSTELVINKNDNEYKGCKTTGEDTTCQKVLYKEKPVPYSAGFCCSCDDKELRHERSQFEEEGKLMNEVNNRQNTPRGFSAETSLKAVRTNVEAQQTNINVFPTTKRSHESRSTFSNSMNNRRKQLLDLEETLDSFEVNDLGLVAEDKPMEIRQKEENRGTDTDKKSAFSKILEKLKKKYQKKYKKTSNDTLNQKLEKECEKLSDNLTQSITKNGTKENYKNSLRMCENEDEYLNPYIHQRGGQDCSNSTFPLDVDPESYQQSTHCLVFSQLWYNVFKLAKPTISHQLSLEIFEKHEDLMGKVMWHDLTKGKPLTIGTSKPEDKDQNEEVWAGYVAQEPASQYFGLDPEIHRLLVPESSETCPARQLPQLQGGPYEWLVIPSYMITLDGSRCDKVGTGYEAFVKQPNRCNMPRGTCLKNQPKDLWSHDHRLEEVGQSGSYFLKYFGFLPRCPIRNVTEGMDGQNFTMYFRSAYFNTINIELKTEFNLVVRPHAAAVITEVYVDSTNYIKSTITVKITNTGLMYGIFYVALTDCPLDMPASFNNIQTKSAVIHPQHQHIFVMEIMCSLPKRRFYCSIEAKSIRNELLAFRRVRFQKNDRCLCIWHCVCTCLETDCGLKCQPLPFDHYNAAGFHGGLPMAANFVRFTLIEELMTLLYHLFLTMTFVLILLGVMKGIIGFFYTPIGEWGLCSMLSLPKAMSTYHENSLKGRKVIYDKCGWPIHPDTKKRVRNASMVVEFCLNIVFFLIYPLVMINMIVKRLCFVDATNEKLEQPCCLCGQKHETGKCSSLGIFNASFQYKSLDSDEHCSCY